VTSPRLLLPLRVPELGPSLGKLVTGTGRDPGGLSLDGIRYQLVTRMIETAGEARRLAGNEERAPAIFAVSRVLWLTAWEETVTAVAGMLLERVTAEINREADRVSMPPKVRERFFPTASDRRSLTARLGSAGSGLVPVLDELDRRGEAALSATALDRPVLDEWHDALRMAARRLENAWMLLEERTETEVNRWKPVVEQVARWRKPLAPVIIVTVVALAAAAWLGLALGGFIPAPDFLHPLIDINP
jgi:hypothetical protein